MDTIITPTRGRKNATPSRKTKRVKDPDQAKGVKISVGAFRSASSSSNYAREGQSSPTHGSERAQDKTERARCLATRLAEAYPDARITLNFATPWQCLAATILSAQCTDKRVNQLTPRLFAVFPDPATTASASPEQIEELIRSAGFFREKARALIAAAREIVDRFDGDVPATMAHLLGLKGVGRKTANVVLGHVFGQPAVAVDTHVRRVAYRLGLTRQRDPNKIERDIAKLLPPEHWTAFSMRLILHGREVCCAHNPRCVRCVVADMCSRRGVKG